MLPGRNAGGQDSAGGNRTREDTFARQIERIRNLEKKNLVLRQHIQHLLDEINRMEEANQNENNLVKQGKIEMFRESVTVCQEKVQEQQREIQRLKNMLNQPQ